MSIEVRHITKAFGTFVALDQVSLTVGRGELWALLGSSASGKTTLLRVIAGLEQPERGSVMIDGQDLTHRPVQDWQVGSSFNITPCSDT